MRRLLDILADVFLADGGLPDRPVPRDLSAAYRDEVPGFLGDGVLVLHPWEKPVQEALHAFKYDGARAVGAALAAALAGNFGGRFPGGRVLVTWVPGRPFQYLVRGYNPSRVLARGFARHAGLASAGLLAKVRRTCRQATLDRQGRLDNLRGAFGADPRQAGKIRGADVVVVDDVVTTGATFQEIARVLKDAGARTVTGVFVASSTR